jgi:hypothetical protein
MTSNSQILHIRRNVCEIMIIEDDIGKHIGTQEHQIRKKALEDSLANLEEDDDGYLSIVLKWSQELSSPNSY